MAVCTAHHAATGKIKTADVREPGQRARPSAAWVKQSKKHRNGIGVSRHSVAAASAKVIALEFSHRSNQTAFLRAHHASSPGFSRRCCSHLRILAEPSAEKQRSRDAQTFVGSPPMSLTLRRRGLRSRGHRVSERRQLISMTRLGSSLEF